MGTSPTIRQKWYPRFSAGIPREIQEAFKRVCDMVYETNEKIGPLNVYQAGSGTQQLSATQHYNVPGCQTTLPRSGQWLVSGSATLNVIGAGDTNVAIELALFHQGTVLQTKAQVIVQSQPTTITITQTWQIDANLKDVIKLQAKKAATAAGTSTVDGSLSSISAVYGGVG